MRRILLALATAVMLAVPFMSASPASAFCGPDEGCSPCGPELVIDGKNTRLEAKYC